jgi:hypothetical protein
MAPELFEECKPTKASDVYALGMTAWHVRVLYVIDDPEYSRVARSTAELFRSRRCRVALLFLDECSAADDQPERKI